MKLWSVATGEELRAFTGHRSQVEALAFSPDGQTLASGDYEGWILLWEVASGNPKLSPLRVSDKLRSVASVASVAFSADGRVLTGVSKAGDSFRWKTRTGERLSAGNAIVIHPPNRPVTAGARPSLTVRRRGLRVEVRDNGGIVHRSFEGKVARGFQAALSADGRVLVAGYNVNAASKTGDENAAVFIVPRGVRGWNLAEGSCRTLVEAVGDEERSLALSPDGTRMAVGSLGEGVALWNMATRSVLFTLPAEETRGASSLAFSPDGRQLAVWTPAALTVWSLDTRTSRRIRTDRERSRAAAPPAAAVSGEPNRSAQSFTLLFSPDGRFLAGADGKAVKLWDMTSEEPRHRFLMRSISPDTQFSPEMELT